MFDNDTDSVGKGKSRDAKRLMRVEVLGVPENPLMGINGNVSVTKNMLAKNLCLLRA